MPKTMSRLSTDDVLVPVQLVIPDGANPVTPNDVVEFAFVIGGLPPRAEPNGSWTTGFWLQTAGQLLAGVRVGPSGAIDLGPGIWAVWVKILDNPTTPVEAVDTLTIL